jgi:hypothetical protein
MRFATAPKYDTKRRLDCVLKFNRQYNRENLYDHAMNT